MMICYIGWSGRWYRITNKEQGKLNKEQAILNGEVERMFNAQFSMFNIQVRDA